jgi:D-alanyl-D-alanine carboxypeptidase
MTWLGLLLGVACALSRQGSADTVGLTAYGSTQLNAAVERWLSSGGYRRAPALSVAVGVNGQLVFARGYGEARPGLPATEHTVYHIGSLSKQFTAAAVLALVDRGALAPRSNDAINLASSARDFFADVDNWDGSGHGPVTLRGLLTMTSGLPSLIAHPPAQADPWGPITSARMLDQLRTLAVPATSTGFVYNNSAYFLLAEIVETVVAGDGPGTSSFADFVKGNIISRLGLSDTSFIGDYASYSAMRTAMPSWGRTPAYRRRPAFVEADWLKGAADMASSAFDLFTWNKALMGNDLLSAQSRHLMFSDAARVGASTYYGMGWFIEHSSGWDWYSHSGYVPGFTSSNTIARHSPDGAWISVSLLTNADGVNGLNELASEVVRTVMHQTSAAGNAR